MAIIYSYPKTTPVNTDLIVISRQPSDPDETATYSVSLADVATLVTGGGLVTSLNDLTDCLIDNNSEYIGTVPSGVSGSNNTTLGIFTGKDLTSGFSNSLIGSYAGQNITTGSSNIAIGTEALKNTQDPDNSVAIGVSAGNAASGDDCIYIGGSAGRVNTGDSNIFIGLVSGFSHTSGVNNTVLGRSAGFTNTTGSNRVCVGYVSGYYNTGADNTFIGYKAGEGSFSVNSTGAQNTVVGSQAGKGLTTGGNNVLIGQDAGSTLTTGSNSIVIGQNAEPSAATTSNEITLGNASITSLRIPGLQSGATDGDVLTFSSSTNNITLQSGPLTKLVTLSAAQIISLNGSSSLELIPAPGAGKIIVVSDILFFLDYGGVAFNITGSGSVRFAYGSSAGIAFTNYVNILNKTADYYLTSNENLEPEANQALNFKSDSIAVTAGNSLVKFNIVYRILDATTLA